MQVYALGFVLGVALVVGIGLQVAQAAWTAPTEAPTGGNVKAPITTSIDLQVKDGSLGIGGNLLLSSILEFNPVSASTYDVHIRGVDGAITRKALTGNKTSDILYLNEGAGYTGGTTVGGSKLTASKICLPNSTESNCRTSWGDVGAITVSAGGHISVSSSASMGSDWTVIILSGTMIDSDAAAAGGFVYKIGSSVVARLYLGTGFAGTYVLPLSSGSRCLTPSPGYSICVSRNGVGEVTVSTGSQIDLTYLAIK